MQSPQESIVVVGFGWVGQANALSLSKLGFNVYFYDPASPDFKYKDSYGETYKEVKRLESVLEKDSESTWYLVCVGDRVSEEGVQDISSIKKALEALRGSKGGVILRSTILPEYLKELPFDYYLPEFLHEKKAVLECLNPHYFIVGKKTERPEPSFFPLWKKRAVKFFQGTPEEVSYIKYLSNIWNSLRIAFVNEFGNAIGEPKDEKSLRDIEKVINFFFEGKSYLRYGRSFGGHCLPKDTRAFSAFLKRKGKSSTLIEAAYASNMNHVAIEKKYSILPEWFSEWVRPELGGVVALKALLKSIGRKIKRPFRG